MAPEILPYARQSICDDDIRAVVDVLRSDWLTTGPLVDQFENALAKFVKTTYAAALNSGTAALHAMMHAIEIGPGDEVIVPAITFAATANCVLYQQGTPVFADVDPATLLIDPSDVEKKITKRTKAVIAVDYAGQTCDYAALRSLAKKHGLFLCADASHSLGGFYRNQPVGTLADMTSFSFHPVKPITTGEGGMVVSDNESWIRRIKSFRNHGIEQDHRHRTKNGQWFYSMSELGFNYRLSDIQCALGLSQLSRIEASIRQRQEIAERYDSEFADIETVSPLKCRAGGEHGYHLYVIKWNHPGEMCRDDAFTELRNRGIGVNVHYVPVHLHSYYQQHQGTRPGMCPVSESAYQSILSLPMYPAMTSEDVDRVITEIKSISHPRVAVA